MSPTNLTGLAQDSSTVVLSWEEPGSGHNGIIREYRVNFTEVETGRVFQEVSPTTSLVVSGLHPDYTYEWMVTAFTVGEGPFSIMSSVTTLEDGMVYRTKMAALLYPLLVHLIATLSFFFLQFLVLHPQTSIWWH